MTNFTRIPLALLGERPRCPNRMHGVRLHGAVRMRCAVLSAFACRLHQTADERIAGLHRVSCLHHWLSLERTHLRDHAVPRGHHLGDRVLVQHLRRVGTAVGDHGQAVAPQIEREKRDIRLQLHHLPPYLTGVQLLDGHADAHAHFAQLLHDSRFVYRRCDLGLYRPYMRAEQPAQRRGEYGSAPKRRARTQMRRKERQTAFSENMHAASRAAHVPPERPEIPDRQGCVQLIPCRAVHLPQRDTLRRAQVEKPRQACACHAHAHLPASQQPQPPDHSRSSFLTRS